MPVKIPVEFDEICRCFYQGIMLHYPTFEAQIEMVLEERSRPHLEIAKAFLDELLSGRYDAEQLNVIWSRTSADIAIFDGTDKSAEPGIVYFLRLFRSMVEQKLAQGHA